MRQRLHGSATKLLLRSKYDVDNIPGSREATHIDFYIPSRYNEEEV